MKSRNKKRLLALVLCMVVAISNSSFIFASETGQAEYPQEAEVQTQEQNSCSLGKAFFPNLTLLQLPEERPAALVCRFLL